MAAPPAVEAVHEGWYRLILELVRHTPIYSPPVASRAFAYLAVAAYEAVAGGRAELRSLAGQLRQLTPPPSRDPALAYDEAALLHEALAAAAWAELAEEEADAREKAAASGDPFSPWHRVDGWRLNLGSHHSFAFTSGDARHEVHVDFADSGNHLRIGARRHAFSGERLADGMLLVRLDGHAHKARAVRDGEHWHVFLSGTHYRVSLEDDLRGRDLDAAGPSLAAPMPGKVIQVLVRAGEKVDKGAPLMVLEAMKMEHTIAAPAAGVVKEIYFAAGDQVSEGAELLKLEDE